MTGEDKLSPIGFKATNLENLPTVCLTENDNECQVVLFTLPPAEQPLQTANVVLDSILVPELQENKIDLAGCLLTGSVANGLFACAPQEEPSTILLLSN